MGAAAYGPIDAVAISAPARHRDARGLAQEQGRASRGGRHRRRARAPDRRGRSRHGRAVQGRRLRASRRSGAAARIRVSASAMLQAASLATRAHPPRASSPAAAACRRASMPASTAASAPTTRPTRSPKTAPAWRRRSASRRSVCSPPIRSIRPTWWSPTSHGRRRTARAPTPSSPARRGSRSACPPPTAGRCCLPTPRRGVIGAAHAGWRGALTGVIEATVAAMEKLGAERSPHRGGARPHHPAAELRGRAGIRRALPGGRRRQCALLRGRRRAPATPCSISPATSPSACSAPASCNFEDLGLCTYAEPERFFSYRRTTAAGRARLRPAYQRHRARRLTRRCGDRAARLDSQARLAATFHAGRGT